MKRTVLPLALFLSGLLAVACGGSTNADDLGDGTTPGAAGGAAGSGQGAAGQGAAGKGAAGQGAGGGATATGLPCEVASLLQSYCVACHSNPPTMSAPVPLVTYDDLMKTSVSKGKTYAQLSLERMQSASSPMPPDPNPKVPAEAIAAYQAWLDQGAPQTGCATGGEGGAAGAAGGAGAGGGVVDPYDTPVQCTSNKKWTLGNHGSGDMNPGQACLACHKTEFEAPKYAIMGTVYPTAHEPNNCDGEATTDPNVAAAQITVTDATGKVFGPVNARKASGNFYIPVSVSAVKFPITAKVSYNGKERVMNTPADTGDCNSCHTQDGAKDAPGRIMLP